MPWPIDESKLDRVRALMKDQDLTALVVRAPDNVLYLTNYWCMKGYDAAVFPARRRAHADCRSNRNWPTPSATPGQKTFGFSRAITKAILGRRNIALSILRCRC